MRLRTPMNGLQIWMIAGVLLASQSHAAQLDIQGPSGSGAFGTAVTVLPNGNFVVTDPGFDLPGPISDVGAVYLYRPSGSLISTLTGSLAADSVGSNGIVLLANGNFVVRSGAWNGFRGAVTWGSASAGVSGAVSASNSLVGGTEGDGPGSENNSVTALSNGNYVVRSPSWDNPIGAITDAGAVTWGNGSSGTVGLLSASNSLIGGTAGDLVGIAVVVALSNSNYVVRSSSWTNPAGAISGAGAVTWGNGSGGTVGLVSASNSLVGSTTGDTIGSGPINSGSIVTALSNGNYVVRSPFWDNPVGVISNAGAVTWGNGSGGTVGPLSASNSLVGTTAGDLIGERGAIALSNGNYVVNSSSWDNPVGAIANVGAVTWGNGSGGTVGPLSASNSLIGGTAGDVGSDSSSVTVVTALSNGNYVVRSPFWDNPVGPIVNAGAVTWGNGSGGTVGLLSASNSLIGGAAEDIVGRFGVTALSNGNYVVSSRFWDNPVGMLFDAGAATWGNGSGGTVGLVSASNSLVGGTIGDNVGFVTALSNGNYVVNTSSWDNPVGPISNAGATTWGNGSTGTTGLVTASNSLVGGTTDDLFSSGVTALSNGNYVVRIAHWDNPVGAIAEVGAITWGNGSGGTVGLVTASNSLVGGSAFDNVGAGADSVTALSNGNYVVHSQNWSNPVSAIAGVGAVTWGNGSSGTVGLVTVNNSLVGDAAGDVSAGVVVTALSNGNYVVRTPTWNNPAGPVVDVGAVTSGSGSGGTVGLISTSNSVVGTVASGGSTLVFSVDPSREQLIVGRRGDNIVTIFRDFFRDGFE